MPSRTTSGEAFRHGRALAAVEITESAEMSALRIPRAGSPSYAYKPRVTRLPSQIVFLDIYDDTFRKELGLLAQAAESGDARKRQLRDHGASRVQFELSLEDTRQLAAEVTWPEFAGADVEDVSFPLATRDLSRTT